MLGGPAAAAMTQAEKDNGMKNVIQIAGCTMSGAKLEIAQTKEDEAGAGTESASGAVAALRRRRRKRSSSKSPAETQV
mgnify:FL=1